MVLEKHILPFLDWFPGAAVIFLFCILFIGLMGLLFSYLVTAVNRGPLGALKTVSTTIGTGFRDLANVSLRRTIAMARLAVQESIRRYVLVVFAVFAVILLFAGWYLDVESDNPGRLYISFVLKTTNFLVILLSIFLSSFSLPNDMKNRTIYTVVTKPVRAWEIVFGRILGFSAIGTLILILMGISSWVFVVRGLDHEHHNDVASLQQQEDGTGWMGRTARAAHHRHEFTIDESGSGASDSAMGHYHSVMVDGTDSSPQATIGAPTGGLQARVPVYARLEFFDRKGAPAEIGINVGKEWTYRGYVEGGTLASAVWHFEGLRRRDYPDGLPLEMTIRVFRTYQGKIERGILGSMEIRNPNPALNDESARAQLDQDTAIKSRSINFTAQEFTPESRLVPRRIEAQMLDGTWRTVDLFESLSHNGKIDILVRCDERAQYYGMAATDLYIRSADNFFVANFFKSYVTLWLQMLVVTSLGVMFSTFLTGSVAMLATFASIVVGYFAQSIQDVASGKAEGGGPVEAAIRIFKQENLTSPLEGGASINAIQGFDSVAMFLMRIVSYLMPNFREFAEYGGMNTARFVAYGFDIRADLMVQHLVITLAYVTVATCAGYFFLKTREIAA